MGSTNPIVNINGVDQVNGLLWQGGSAGVTDAFYHSIAEAKGDIGSVDVYMSDTATESVKMSKLLDYLTTNTSMDGKGYNGIYKYVTGKGFVWDRRLQ